MELQHLKKGDRFKLDAQLNGKRITDDTVYIFDHLDGMYSFIRVEGSDEVTHFKGWTPVILL